MRVCGGGAGVADQPQGSKDAKSGFRACGLASLGSFSRDPAQGALEGIFGQLSFTLSLSPSLSVCLSLSLCFCLFFSLPPVFFLASCRIPIRCLNVLCMALWRCFELRCQRLSMHVGAPLLIRSPYFGVVAINHRRNLLRISDRSKETR